MTWGQIGVEAALALIPVLVMVLITLVTVGIGYLRQRWTWLKQTQVDEQVELMARNVVISIQHDVVEGLKAANADGKLTAEEIAMIKAQALATLQQQLTEGQRKVLATITSDISAWLAGTIERVLEEYKLDVATTGSDVPVLVIEPNPTETPASPTA